MILLLIVLNILFSIYVTKQSFIQESHIRLHNRFFRIFVAKNAFSIDEVATVNIKTNFKSMYSNGYTIYFLSQLIFVKDHQYFSTL